MSTRRHWRYLEVTERIVGRLFGGSVVLLALALPAVVLALALAGCGDDDDETTTNSSTGADLTAVKDYLTTHSADLVDQVTVLRELGEEYYELAESVDFDYAQLLKAHGDELERLLTDSKDAYVAANPAYEEMEGIVAGVPRLAQYDVDIDAGSDASDPESAVSFSLNLPNGETLKQPGNLFFVTETSLYGTNPDFLAEGTKQDVDGDGEEEFGEGIPDANVYVAAVREFDEQARALDADAQEFEPTPSDAFTALTIMTPTMSEYFEAWKNSRFVAGEAATEQAFVAASRLQDIADILEGLVFTYEEIEPLVAEESSQQAEQTRRQLADLLAYVEDLRDQEAAGEEYTAEQADTLGAEAQRRAEAIAGQVTQSAQRLGIELQEA
jgi:Imelysin